MNKLVVKCKLANFLLEIDKSQKWLSEEIGVSMTTISQIKKGKRLPTLIVALQISKALNKSVEEIWVVEDESID